MDDARAVAQDAAAGSTLRERLESVRSRIAAAAKRSGRRADSVLLVVVTKGASIDQIRELVALGQTDFGENRVQQLIQRVPTVEEFLERRRMLGPTNAPGVRWHMVGTLQRNKVRKCIELVRLIHSVDNLRLAEEIQAAAMKREEPVDVLVEVNVSGERSKQGVAPAAAKHLVDQMETMVNLRARGLMCMAPLQGGLDAARLAFDRCRELHEEIRRSGAGGGRFDILSMGMSGDFEVAIECGANLVRVGSAVVGASTQAEPEAEG